MIPTLEHSVTSYVYETAAFYRNEGDSRAMIAPEKALNDFLVQGNNLHWYADEPQLLEQFSFAYENACAEFELAINWEQTPFSERN